MTAIQGSAAAVTGAASGIGRALALELAARGCDLALADRDEAGLQAVAAEIAKAAAAQGERRTAWMSARPNKFRSSRRPRPPRIQNSTSSSTMPASPCSASSTRSSRRRWNGLLTSISGAWCMRRGPSCRILSRQPASHIVNLSSIFGIIAPPGQTAYCAAKFAVRGFSESLRHELAMANSPVRLSVVHPGGVLTNIVRNSRTGVGVTDNARRAQSIERFDAIAKTTPPAAAQRIILGIEKNQPRILIGGDARFMDLLQRFRPATLLGGAGEADREDGGECGEVRGAPYLASPSSCRGRDPWRRAVMLEQAIERRPRIDIRDRGYGSRALASLAPE